MRDSPLPWHASLGATVVLALLMAAAKWLFAAPLPPEMAFNFAGYLLGVPWVFNLIHGLPWGLDAAAKYLLFGFTTLLFFALLFALGLLAPRLRARLGAAGMVACYAALMTLLVGLVLLPLQRLGLFGRGSFNFLYPPLATHLWAAGFGLAFGLALLLARRRPRPHDPARRESLRALTLGALALALGGSLQALARAQGALSSAFGQLLGLSPEVTPTREHYVVSKNIFNPAVAAPAWSLTIKGLVARELRLTLDDLKALPSVERSSTLTCISNPVGGDLIGNSVWTGVRLAELLVQAGVQPDASELALRAADNYSDSFPLEAALREGTIVAYLQNGEPLTRDHGFPARVLVPGIYGMKNVKWVTEIELTSSDYQGYWQQRGWSDVAIVQTMSRIDTREATRLPSGAVIGGVAFAGLRGVSRVEVSLDGGSSWQPAELKPALNELSWNLWLYAWDAPPGRYEVLVRATDGSGEVQSGQPRRPLPDGATGYHRLNVRVG